MTSLKFTTSFSFSFTIIDKISHLSLYFEPIHVNGGIFRFLFHTAHHLAGIRVVSKCIKTCRQSMCMLYYVLPLASSDKYVHATCCTLGVIPLPQVCEHLFVQDCKTYTSHRCVYMRGGGLQWRNLTNSMTRCFSSNGFQMRKNLPVVFTWISALPA